MDANSHNIWIFTDGACLGNPGPGGWGTIIWWRDRSTIEELGGGVSQTTNNKMELQAVRSGLERVVEDPGAVLVLTDSRYVMDALTRWIHNWKKNGFRTAAGKPVGNQEFMVSIDRLLQGRTQPTHWKHLRAHTGIPGNERCDTIGKGFAEGGEPELFQGPASDYAVDLERL